MVDNGSGSKGPSYKEARAELIRAEKAVRLYGVQLENAASPDTIPLWYCGFQIGSSDYRLGSKRIFRLPSSGVLANGLVDGFEYEGYAVCWFDVALDARIVEEVHTGFDARAFAQLATGHDGSDTDITALERLIGFGSGHLLEPRSLGLDPVPIIIPLDPPPDNPTGPPIIIPLDPP